MKQQNTRKNNIASTMQIPNNGDPSMQNPANADGQRSAVNPAQLLLQHDDRLFQIEKLVKSLHENSSKDGNNLDASSGDNQEINMEEIKIAVSNSMYESERLKEIVSNEDKNSIESAYDFDSFYDNLQRISSENQTMKDKSCL